MNILPVSSSQLPTASPPVSGRTSAESSVAGTTQTTEASATEAVLASGVGSTNALDTAKQTAQTSPSKEVLQKALDDVKQAIPPSAQDLLFSIDKDTGRTVVKVVDASTKKVIKQIPSEEIIAIAKSLDKFDKLQGLLVKQKA